MMMLNARASHLSRASAAVAISCAAFLSAACEGTVGDSDPPGVGGTGGDATIGGNGGTTMTEGGGSGVGGAAGSPVGGGGGSPTGGAAGASTGATGGAAGSAGAGPLSTGGVKLRLLTQAEYRASLQSLFGDVTALLDLPQDTALGGFISIGAAQITLPPVAIDKYEAASRAVVAEVFGDTARWQALVGCQPQANLSDACVETFVRAFGERAFRRDLSELEFGRWVKVARDAAVLAGNAAQGLSALTSGFLQSPNFLYRVETNALDPANGRLKYDGRSMAIRLAFLLTGGPPSAELMAAGESGQLDTVEGVRAAVAPMLSDPAIVGPLTSFFYEYSQAELVMTVEKSPTMFPDVNDNLRSSMREGTRLFLEKVVLAPGADVRSLFDSNKTFADATLAPIYGLAPPSSGFAEFTVPAEQGRVGLMGQAAMLFAHGKPDHSSPTIRGLFMLQAFFCQTPDPPPGGLVTELSTDPNLTTRQKLELHRTEPSCKGCHAMFDPMGMALEHFDSIGRYRETENGLTIDPSGMLEDGSTFNGAVEFGTVLRNSAAVNECLLRHFYRSVNGRADDLYDQAQVDAMLASLSSRGYVFRDLVADFVVSDAFRSAPALPITGENQ